MGAYTLILDDKDSAKSQNVRQFPPFQYQCPTKIRVNGGIDLSQVEECVMTNFLVKDC